MQQTAGTPPHTHTLSLCLSLPPTLLAPHSTRGSWPTPVVGWSPSGNFYHTLKAREGVTLSFQLLREPFFSSTFHDFIVTFFGERSGGKDSFGTVTALRGKREAC